MSSLVVPSVGWLLSSVLGGRLNNAVDAVGCIEVSSYGVVEVPIVLRPLDVLLLVVPTVGLLLAGILCVGFEGVVGAVGCVGGLVDRVCDAVFDS
jgi:hypothetical protein